MTLKDKCLAGLVVLLWGSNFMAIKVGLDTFPPFLMTGIRFLVVAALLLPFCRIQKKDWIGLMWLSLVLGTGHFGLLFMGVQEIDAGTGSVLVQLGTPFCVVLSALLFKDALPLNKIIGTAMAFGGIFFIAGGVTMESPGHMGLVIVSAFLWGAANLLIKRYPHISPRAMNAGTALLAGPQLLLLSFLFETNQWEILTTAPVQAWVALGYVVLGASVVAYTIWYSLISRYKVSQVVFYPLAMPVVALTAAGLFLGEAVTVHKVLGAAFILGGVAVIELWPHKKATPLSRCTTD